MSNRPPVVLFYPHVPVSARERVRATLDSRWIGQGPQVDEFESAFEERFCQCHKAVAVNSGTSALHLAFILCGINPCDEVIVPVFSCTATMTPLLYLGAKPVFADIQQNTFNLDPSHVESLMNERVKAIVCVHYGGLPCDMKELQAIAAKWCVPIIEDAAHAIGATYHDKPVGAISEFTCFSFQAIKMLTTTDGGMLTLKDPALQEKAKRLRWFGIDRKAKFDERWKHDIWEVGYKYQMTDVAAAMGIESLKELEGTLAHYRSLFTHYKALLKRVPGITVFDQEQDRRSSCWLITILAEDRGALKRKLAEHNIQADPVHYRCDRYTVFRNACKPKCPNMDYLESRYLVLPMHFHMSVNDVENVCSVIGSGW